MVRWLVLPILMLAACGSDEEPRKEVPVAPKEAAAASAKASAPEPPEAGGGAEKAGAPQGAPPALGEAVVEAMDDPSKVDPAQMALAMSALERARSDQQRSYGPPVDPSDLGAWIPAELGGVASEGPPEGAARSMGTLQVTVAARDYAAEGRSLRIEVTDTSLAPALRAPLAMASEVAEDSPEGFERGVTLRGNKGLLKWIEAKRRSRLRLLVGGRFVVDLLSEPAASSEEALDLMLKLDLNALEALAKGGR